MRTWRLSFRRFLVAGAFIFTAAVSITPPNIILIITDDQGLSDIGYEDPQFSTPNLDYLASNGIKMKRMYASTTCSPSRSVLLTGRNVNRIGVQDGPFVIGEGRALSLNFTILPQRLQSLGYHTVGLGKWHQGMSTVAEMPMSRGFDEYFGTLNGALDFMSLEIGNQCNSGNPENPDDLPILWGSNCYAINGFDVNDNGRPALEYQLQNKHYTQVLGEKAVEKILQHGVSPSSLNLSSSATGAQAVTKPLFLYLAPTAPHSPLEVTGEEASRCHISPPYPPYEMSHDPTNRRELICQLMAGVDDMIGAVVNALKQKEMWDNTLLFYLSDNGGVRLFGSTNSYLRGQKGSYFEGGVRVPFFVSGPLLSKEVRGMETDQLVHLTDLYATIASVTGLSLALLHSLLTLPSPLGVSPEILSDSDGLPFLQRTTDHSSSESSPDDESSFVWNSSFQRDKVYLGGAGEVMGIGSKEPGLDRPSAAVVYRFQDRLWKYTDFPNSQAFYGAYEDTPDLGSYLFDLTNDPNETTNLYPLATALRGSSSGETELWKAALRVGLKETEEMYAEGVPSPIDHAHPPRMHINLIPNKHGCWVPPDSPYAAVDCGLGKQVHEMSTSEFMSSMMEMVDKRAAMDKKK
jgi:arylsulfatase A-like enzyme